MIDYSMGRAWNVEAERCCSCGEEISYQTFLNNGGLCPWCSDTTSMGQPEYWDELFEDERGLYI